MDHPERHPRPTTIRWHLQVSPQPSNRVEAREAILDCLYRAMDITSLAFRFSPDYNSVLETIEDLMTEASQLLHRWFPSSREEGPA